MLDKDNLDESIEIIYNKYYRDVYKFLICFTGNQNDAEDLTQDVFIRLLISQSKFNKQCTLKTWVLSIAKHVAIDHHRKKRFYSVFKDSFFKQLVSNRKIPDEILQDNERTKILQLAIQSLKPMYRSIIILRGINEFSIKETATILECNESKVKVDYHRALKVLRKNLNVSIEEVFENAK
ncbi:RNA polymerase sigma factor [Peribacillus butanolivorans]|uniref:RNA polymerase sigma factor n=1 Tax=Peribacillus butanolivorans TaxID=421767 RepID=UPI003631E516